MTIDQLMALGAADHAWPYGTCFYCISDPMVHSTILRIRVIDNIRIACVNCNSSVILGALVAFWVEVVAVFTLKEVLTNTKHNNKQNHTCVCDTFIFELQQEQVEGNENEKQREWRHQQYAHW
jgi:hypothetical protein